ncbi:MAG: nuclear transport factor 2 family protein [Frankiaceae bacterium]
MTSGNVSAQAEAILAAWNSRDYGEIRKHLAPDVVLEDHTRGRIAEGPHGYVDRFQPVLDAFPDMRGETVSLVAQGNVVVHETKWRGRHTVALALPGGGSVPPTNEATTMHLVTYLEFDDGGKAKSVRTYGNPNESFSSSRTVGVG